MKERHEDIKTERNNNERENEKRQLKTEQHTQLTKERKK